MVPKPRFVSIEYQTRDQENLTILRTCRRRWVRNKDIAKTLKMTPAGAKRRNEFLQSIGLLERRRNGKEVQFCTTLLAYLANLRLAEEEPLAAMGVMRSYLDQTKEYSIRLLNDLNTILPGEDEVEAEYHRLRELHATLAYLWPTDILSKLWIDLDGFDRPGAVLHEVNRMIIPIPVMTTEQYELMVTAFEKTTETTGPEGNEVWDQISKEILTGHIGVADYNIHKEKIIEELADSKQKADLHYVMLKRMNESLNQFQGQGPSLVIIQRTLEEIIKDLDSTGLEGKEEIPENIPIGLPTFKIFPPFNEQTYSRIKKTYRL